MYDYLIKALLDEHCIFWENLAVHLTHIMILLNKEFKTIRIDTF